MPKDWRNTNVTPILKNGMKEDLGDYKLVSLTFIPVKMSEHQLDELVQRNYWPGR